MNLTKTEINRAVWEFVRDWQRFYDEYMEANFPTLNNPRIEIKKGRKYFKITREGSVIGFVDTTTGDIFKAASWRAPAPHARGNVFSDQHGAEALNLDGVYHPHVRYLS